MDNLQIREVHRRGRLTSDEYSERIIEMEELLNRQLRLPFDTENIIRKYLKGMDGDAMINGKLWVNLFRRKHGKN